jgi:hypothetical protein
MVRLFRRRMAHCDLTDELTRSVEELHRRLETPPIRPNPGPATP